MRHTTLRSFHDLPATEIYAEEPDPIPIPVKPKFLKALERGLQKISKSNLRLVAGGEILWKPINKQAALMLSKPNQPETMSQYLGVSQQDEELTGAELNNAMGNRMKSDSVKVLSASRKYAQEVSDARNMLDDALDLLRPQMIDFAKEAPSMVDKVRQWRMTMEREKDLSVKALTDLRKFFLDTDHEKEMQRLESFVRTCERLAALAQDGTLDKVAEVMLKLA